MKSLLQFIQSKTSINQNDIDLIEKYFTYEEVPAQTCLLKAGKTEHYVYFLSEGIIKGYQNIDGKIIVQHLVAAQDVFTSLDSFTEQTPSTYYYETITDCKLLKISKPNFDLLNNNTQFWSGFVKDITNEHLSSKLERLKDFQVLTAKKRYLKFITEQPQLALHVSVDNIASYLGIEPQSLSRIRKQIAF